MTVDEKYMEKTLKAVVKSGKYLIGLKEVSNGLRGSKIVIYCISNTGPSTEHLVSECGSLNIPVLKFEPGSVKLGRLCGRNFRVSAIAVKSPGEADFRPVIGDLTKSATQTGT